MYKRRLDRGVHYLLNFLSDYLETYLNLPVNAISTSFNVCFIFREKQYLQFMVIPSVPLSSYNCLWNICHLCFNCLGMQMPKYLWVNFNEVSNQLKHSVVVLPIQLIFVWQSKQFYAFTFSIFNIKQTIHSWFQIIGQGGGGLMFWWILHCVQRPNWGDNRPTKEIEKLFPFHSNPFTLN